MSAQVQGISLAATSGSTSTTKAAQAQDSFASKETFLRLLVEQLRNQDPLSPMDGTEFVTQLSQFSQLEQLIGIRDDLGQLLERIPEQTSSASDQG